VTWSPPWSSSSSPSFLGRHTRIGSRPQVVVRLVGSRSCEPRSQSSGSWFLPVWMVYNSRLLSWVGSYPRLVGSYLDGGLHTGRHRRAVLSCLCSVAQGCRLTGQGDCCPLGPYGVSAACLFLSEQARLARLDLSSFLLGVVTGERSCALRASCG
jgi:hypothetical protein